MKNQKGFSLIELLIVVLIIGIIATIAIPNLLASRRSANEASAISTLRIYHGAQMTYQATTGSGNYAGTDNVLNGFGVLSKARILDVRLDSSGAAAAVKSGYNYYGVSVASSNGQPACHLAVAYPVRTTGPTRTGTRNYSIATEGVIKYTNASVTWSTTYTLTSSPITCVTTGTALNN